MPTILLNLPPHGARPEQVAEIQAILPGYCVLVTQEHDEIEAALAEIEIAAGWPLGEQLVRMPNLRWYQQWFAGTDWLARRPAAATAPFALTTGSGIHAVQIGEHVLALMLAWARRLPEQARRQTAHEWQAPPGESLAELYEGVLLMIGTGAIGARVVQLAAALGMWVLAVRQHADRPLPGAHAVYRPDQLAEALPQADFIVLAAPLSAATRGMIGPAEFGLMKRSAFLVNVGRGGLVQQEALVAALRDGQIAGAGLDVTDPEPLPADSPLWAMSNVIITAHYAGASPRYYERAMAIFLDNLWRYQAGEPLRNLVDKGAVL